MPGLVRPLPLWAGRSLALIGLLVVVVNMRTAVSAISPIVSQISVDIDLDTVVLSVIGMLPPIVFAISGFFTGPWAKRSGLEATLLVAIGAMVVGHLLRTLAVGWPMLLLGSVIALAGAGVANALLPPLIKRYFPDRIGLLTSLYSVMIAVSGALPPLIGTGIADSVGWRYSLGVWMLTAAVSALPWITLYRRHRRERALHALRGQDDTPEVVEPEPELLGKVWHSRLAWSLTVICGIVAAHVYALFAWLPQLLRDVAGVDAGTAALLLGLFSLIAIPGAYAVPILMTKLENVSWVLVAGLLAFVIGYAGVLLTPTVLTWLWVVFMGIGPQVFAAAITLINLRTRTQQGSIALSSFSQGIGYAIGALGPLLVGVAHDITGSWTAPILGLMVTALLGTPAALRLAKPRYLEDEMAARRAS